MRLEYNEVDDAVLDPATARLDGDVLSLIGAVRAGNVARELAPGTSRRARVTLTLRIAPVKSWRFADLERGTGELLAGEFRPNASGGWIEGVIPGDLHVSSPSAPSAWFEIAADEWSGRSLLRPTATSTGSELSSAQRAGLVFRLVGGLSGMVAFLAFFGLISGLLQWEWDWNAPLEVSFGRQRSWVVHFAEAWHYLLPLLVAEVVGVVGFLVGIMGSIDPRRS